MGRSPCERPGRLGPGRGVVGRAVPGEQVEVYVARGHDTEVRAYDGAVESLSSATSARCRHPVVLARRGRRRGQPGRASPGPGRSTRTSSTRRWPKPVTTPASPRRTPTSSWPCRTASRRRSSTCGTTTSSSTPTDEKVELALALERPARADPRIRQVDSADYGDGRVEVALASTAGIRAATRRTPAFLSVAAIAGDGADTQTGSGSPSAGPPAASTRTRRPPTPSPRAARMVGAQRPRRAATRSSSTPGSSRRCSRSSRPRCPARRSSRAGRSSPAGSANRWPSPRSRSSTTRPTSGPSARRRYDGEGLACRRNVLIEAGVLRGFLFDTVAARRAGTASTGSAVRGGFAGTPGAGCRALVLAPGTMDHDEILAAVGDGLYVQSVTGVHSGVNPVSGDFSVGAEGLMVRGGVLAEPVREVTVASTLQRMLQSIVHVGADVEWLPGVAAGQTLAIGDMQLSGD